MASKRRCASMEQAATDGGSSRASKRLKKPTRAKPRSPVTTTSRTRIHSKKPWESMRAVTVDNSILALEDISEVVLPLILQLPTDVLHMLDRCMSTKDAFNLASTCKSVRAALQPVLFTRILWKGEAQKLLPCVNQFNTYSALSGDDFVYRDLRVITIDILPRPSGRMTAKERRRLVTNTDLAIAQQELVVALPKALRSMATLERLELNFTLPHKLTSSIVRDILADPPPSLRSLYLPDRTFPFWRSQDVAKAVQHPAATLQLHHLDVPVFYGTFLTGLLQAYPSLERASLNATLYESLRPYAHAEVLPLGVLDCVQGQSDLLKWLILKQTRRGFVDLDLNETHLRQCIRDSLQHLDKYPNLEFFAVHYTEIMIPTKKLDGFVGLTKILLSEIKRLIRRFNETRLRCFSIVRDSRTKDTWYYEWARDTTRVSLSYTEGIFGSREHQRPKDPLAWPFALSLGSKKTPRPPEPVELHKPLESSNLQAMGGSSNSVADVRNDNVTTQLATSAAAVAHSFSAAAGNTTHSSLPSASGAALISS